LRRIDRPGHDGHPSTRFEAACASSGAAFSTPSWASPAGFTTSVMVVGVEKMTCQPTPRVTEILAGAGRLRGEVKAGSTFPLAVRHDRAPPHARFRHHPRAPGAVAVKNHENGALNPDAQMRKVITIEQAMNARPSPSR
jgi:acetyl-CoA C-acetyltransferase